MLLGLTRLLDALPGSRAEELALMEAHGVATPEEFSRADPPFDVILDEMAGYLGVAGAAAGRLTCRAPLPSLSCRSGARARRPSARGNLRHRPRHATRTLRRRQSERRPRRPPIRSGGKVGARFPFHRSFSGTAMGAR